jgi:hypothetical protein
MTPKERYEARQAAKRAGYVVRERNARDPIHDPEELLFDVANSLDRIATALEAMSGVRCVTNNVTVTGPTV